MKPLKRKPVNKHHSAKVFRKNVAHTKKPNVAAAPMRGGWRL
jgi:hypothetical protein